MSGQIGVKKAAGIVAALAVSAVVVWAIGSVIRSQRSSANRASTKDDVKHIMLAMHQYHDAYDSFPPAFVVGPDGKRWHSWRALLLPYLEPELAKQYRLDEPWNGPHNQKMLANAPDEFRSDCVGPPANVTSYFAVVGRKTMWPADQSVGMRNIMDGTSNTLTIVEDSRTDIQWLEPKDLLQDEFLHLFYDCKPWMKGGGRTVGLADGSARFLSPKLDRNILFSLLTPSYGRNTYRGVNWPADLVEGEPRQEPTQNCENP